MQLGIVQPDLVILDLSAPEGDGWETLRLIRNLSTVPIIALATAGEPDALVNGLACGADYCLTKPLGMKELHARVRALLRRDRLAEQVLQRA
jgi:two-component system KDP operon response regulator KdpE